MATSIIKKVADYSEEYFDVTPNDSAKVYNVSGIACNGSVIISGTVASGLETGWANNLVLSMPSKYLPHTSTLGNVRINSSVDESIYRQVQLSANGAFQIYNSKVGNAFAFQFIYPKKAT